MNGLDLRSRIIVQEKTTTFNEYNEPILTWSTFETLWADVQINQGREFWGAKKLNAELDGLIKIRYNRGVTELMQVVYDNRPYQITAVLHDQRKVWTELHVKKVV
ncbi:MAG TPA: phage head closure protein [Bacillota bacterium]|nr:phage head closure protein [Bacillota bacterium]